MKRPLLIAHRGASRECPENTLRAFERAIELKADYVELDLHLTRDKTCVCHHDDRVHMPVVHAPQLSELTIKEIQILFPEIPTLDQVLRLDWNETHLMLELKEGNEGLVDIVTKQLQGTGFSPVILGSFSLPMMQELSRLWPRNQLVGIVDEMDKIEAHAALRPQRLAIDRSLATESRIHDLHQQSFDVWVWTVDDPEVARTLIGWGVDGIITNDVKKVRYRVL